MKAEKPLLLFFILLCLSLPVRASFCACCAERGQYTISVQKPEKDDFGILGELKFATANLYTTPAYPDDIKGIGSLAENYSVNSLFQNKAWRFTFKDDKGKTGTLSLPAPTSMVVFMADIPNIHGTEEEDPNSHGEPVLYKEWRFKYSVGQGTGIFQNGIAPLTKYFLVLQGRGNNCTSAEDFKSWRLEITGKKASYAFYGNLKATK
jgi:hypothetical protein